MRLRAFISGLAILASVPASAADIFQPTDQIYSAYDWSGFYAGAVAGVEASKANTVTNNVASDFELRGGFAGLTVGANHQFGTWVVGAEADLVWSALSGEAACANPAYTCSGDFDWSGSVRGRLGYALDRTLLYATGGVAVARANAHTSPTAPGLSGSYSDTLMGWTLGAGVELAANDTMSIKAEYAYTDYGTSTAPAGTLSSSDTSIDINSHIMKVGLNYHF